MQGERRRTAEEQKENVGEREWEITGERFYGREKNKEREKKRGEDFNFPPPPFARHTRDNMLIIYDNTWLLMHI